MSVVRAPTSQSRRSTGARGLALRFRLDRRTSLELLVREASPACRPLGLLRLGERAGTTTVRFFGRVKGKLLAPGTYALVVRARRDGRVSELAVLRVRVVRRPGAPPAVLRVPGRPPRCVVPAVSVATSSVTGGQPEVSGVAGVRRDQSPPAAPEAAERRPFVARAVDKMVHSAAEASALVRGLLLALFVFVLLTLTLAFIPPRLVPWPPLARALAAWRSIRHG